MTTKKKIAIIITVVLALLASAVFAFFLLQPKNPSIEPANNNNVVVNANNNNANTNLDSHSSSTTNENIAQNNTTINTNMNANTSTTNENRPIFDANGAHIDYNYVPVPTENTKVDTSNVPQELKNTESTMDREKLKATAESFIKGYFSGDADTIRSTISTMGDTNYLAEQGTKSKLYMNITYSQLMPEERYQNTVAIDIDNAQAPNATLTLTVNALRPKYTETSVDGWQNATVKVKIKMNSYYQIKELRYL